jgi:hypothetical protein
VPALRVRQDAITCTCKNVAVPEGKGLQRGNWDSCCNQAITVRRERRWTTAGGKTRPGTGSLHPVAIGAAVEATKPLKPPVERVA